MPRGRRALRSRQGPSGCGGTGSATPFDLATSGARRYLPRGETPTEPARVAPEARGERSSPRRRSSRTPLRHLARIDQPVKLPSDGEQPGPGAGEPAWTRFGDLVGRLAPPLPSIEPRARRVVVRPPCPPRAVLARVLEDV